MSNQEYPVGSIWKTENGLKAVVVDEHLSTKAGQSNYLKVYVSGEVLEYSRFGSHFDNPDLNLKEPWKEPEYKYTNINTNPDTGSLEIGGIYDTREKADLRKSENRKGCMKILLEERFDD